jgi:signal transduction histidine kinase
MHPFIQSEALFLATIGPIGWLDTPDWGQYNVSKPLSWSFRRLAADGQGGETGFAQGFTAQFYASWPRAIVPERELLSQGSDDIKNESKGKRETSLHPDGSPVWATLKDSVVLPPLYQEMQEAYTRLLKHVQRRTVALAAATHELRTPLTIISGYTEFLLSEKAGPLNDQQRRALLDTQENCKRLNRFIQDVLTYSALETGKIPMKFEEGDVGDCLAEVYETWLRLFHKKGVSLYYLTRAKIERFKFDYFKIQQIVSNLLENALKFTPTGGTVWISAETSTWDRRIKKARVLGEDRRRGASGSPTAVQVTVADTGPGIAPEYQLEVFDDFFRPPESEGKSGGAGLGLAIARRLIQSHGGKIWVESDGVSGSRFSFLLPMMFEGVAGHDGVGIDEDF